MAAQQNRNTKVHQAATAKTDTPQPVKYKKVEKRDIPDDPAPGTLNAVS